VKLNRTASEKRISPLDLLSRKNLLPALTDFSAVENLVSRFTGWMVRANNESALDSFIAIVSDTKFQEYLLGKQESIEKVEKLAKLYDEVKSFLTTHKDATLKDFMNSIDTLLRHSGVISFSRRTLGARGVAVMTAHKSKGLEWQRVYIVNAGDKVWGNRRGVGGFKLPAPLGGGEESEENEDERRLFLCCAHSCKRACYDFILEP
jgi:superfamily I DNA/RNA helicase